MANDATGVRAVEANVRTTILTRITLKLKDAFTSFSRREFIFRFRLSVRPVILTASIARRRDAVTATRSWILSNHAFCVIPAFDATAIAPPVKAMVITTGATDATRSCPERSQMDRAISIGHAHRSSLKVHC